MEPLLDPLHLARRVGKRVWRISQEVLWVQPRSGIQFFCSHAVVQNPGFWPELRSTLLRGRLVNGVQLHAQEIEEISFGASGFSRGYIRNVLEVKSWEGYPLLGFDPNLSDVGGATEMRI